MASIAVHTNRRSVRPRVPGPDNLERAGKRSDETSGLAANDCTLAMLVHEMRGPLTAIRGWLLMLQSTERSSIQFPRALEILTRNAERLSTLLDGAWDSSRASIGRMHVVTTKVDVRPIVQEVVDSVRPEADSVRVGVTWTSPPRPLFIRADPDRIVQIVRNLLENAIKFTPSNGRVRVAAVACGQAMHLSVSDTGPGIAPDQLERIFEPFKQGAARGRGRGFGLGLTIAKLLVEMHGGHIRASNQGLNQGATFTVTLPLAEFCEVGS
jgi:signal transduction histidine kinase